MSAGPFRVVIAGGGTGGHLFPGLALAQEILRRRPDARVSFAGTARGLEARVVPAAGFELDLLRSAGLKGKSLAKMAHGLTLLPAGALDARRILARRAPHVVIGVGGYSSGPVVLMASAQGIPTLVLEQNAVPGLTNRLLARVVSAAAVTFPTTLPYFSGKGFVSGNPVRSGFVVSDPELHRPMGDTPKVLIFGGSQGAHAINVAMADAAPDLAASTRRPEITHQTGAADREMVEEAYRRAGLRARVEPFIDAMDREMKAADLVVCRAGATTIAEVTASARPAILVPLPGSTDDHQRRNAEQLSAAGAADMIEQGMLTGSLLAKRIAALMGDDSRRRAMAKAAWAFARPDAAKVIVERALELVESRRPRRDGTT